MRGRVRGRRRRRGGRKRRRRRRGGRKRRRRRRGGRKRRRGGGGEGKEGEGGGKEGGKEEREETVTFNSKLGLGLGELIQNLLHVHVISVLTGKVNYLQCTYQNCPVSFTIQTKLM